MTSFASCKRLNPWQSWILDSTPWILHSRYSIWDSFSVKVAIRIQIVPDFLSCTPDSKAPDFRSHNSNLPDSEFHSRNFPDCRIRIPLCGAACRLQGSRLLLLFYHVSSCWWNFKNNGTVYWGSLKYWNSFFLSSVATDGRDRLGLKLGKFCQIFNAMPANKVHQQKIVMVSAPWRNLSDVFFILCVDKCTKWWLKHRTDVK